jgi:DNA-binding LacI/PurR family transcriptional regulator
MPITQDRILALCDAAQAAYSKLEALSACVAASAAAENSEDALAGLAAVMHLYALEPRHIATLIRERTHFEMHRHRNARNAARMRKVRHAPRDGDEEYFRPAPPAPDAGAIAAEMLADGSAAALFADIHAAARVAPAIGTDGTADGPLQIVIDTAHGV